MASGLQFSMPGLAGYGPAGGVYADQTPRQYMSPPNPEAPASSQSWGNQPNQQWGWPNPQ
jgi:hypothetical protein